jgi:hypothetical protein
MIDAVLTGGPAFYTLFGLEIAFILAMLAWLVKMVLLDRRAA